MGYLLALSMQAIRNIRNFSLLDPRTIRTLGAVGLLCLAAVGGYASVQEGMKYPAAVALFCLMVLFRRWQEPYVLAGAIALFVFAGSSNGFLQDKGLTYRWHGLFLLVGIGLFRTGFERRWHVKLRGLHTGIAIWIGYVIWSSFWAWDIEYSFPRAVAVGIVGFAVFFSLWRYLEGWEQLELVLKSLLGALIPLAALQFLGTYQMDALRFQGIMNHVNGLGLLTVLIAPFAVYIVLDAPLPPLWKLAGGLLCILGFILVYMCASRAALVGAGVAILVYLAVRNPKQLILAGLAVLLLVGILIGYEVDIIDTFGIERLIRPETLATGTHRTTAWWIGWMQHLERPVWGYGFASGTFLLTETSFIFISQLYSLGRYHNTYIELLVDTGWMGTLPFLIFLGYMGFRGLRAFRGSVTDPRYHLAVLGLGSVVLAGLTHAVFETWLFSPGGPVTLLFWSLTACWMKLVLEPEFFTETLKPVEAAPVLED